MFAEISIAFGIALVISVSACLILLRIGDRVIRRRPAETGRSKMLIPRFGGVAFGLASLIAVALFTDRFLPREMLAFLVGGGLVIVLGVADDFKVLSWKAQLSFQVALVLFLFIVGIRIESLPLPDGGRFFFAADSLSLLLQFLILLSWFLLIMNAVNWIDGSDGLSGSVVLIAIAVIFFLALQPEVRQGGVALIAAAGGGAVFGFLFFNWPPARVYAGTGGAYFLGFFVAYLSVIAGTKIASAGLVLAIPLLDALRVIGGRWRRKTPIFLPDESHVHHELASLGMSPTTVLLLLTSFTLLAGVLAAATERFDKFLSFVTVALFVIVFELWVEYKLSKRRRKERL